MKLFKKSSSNKIHRGGHDKAVFPLCNYVPSYMRKHMKKYTWEIPNVTPWTMSEDIKMLVALSSPIPEWVLEGEPCRKCWNKVEFKQLWQECPTCHQTTTMRPVQNNG